MVLSIFIDLKKAFDTVSHKVILNKLELLGIRDVELKWFENYLTNRQQVVHLNGHTSPPKSLHIGVQQGSLLGVILFQLLINDLPTVLKFSTSILYADDTTLFIIGRSLCFLKIKMQSDLNHLDGWLVANNLKLNVSKTKYMLLNKEGLFPDIDLFIEEQKLEGVNCFKFLGIQIDHDLSFKQHFATVHHRLQSAIFIIRSLSKTLPRSCLRSLYFAYFESHLLYGLPIWFPLLLKQNQDKLYLMQKRITRILSGANLRDHCMPLMRRQKILTIYDLLKLENCKLIFKIENNLSPVTVCNLFTRYSHTHSTRGINFSIPKHRLHKLNCSFLCKSVTDWQSIPATIKNSDKLKNFVKKLKEYYISRY